MMAKGWKEAMQVDRAADLHRQKPFSPANVSMLMTYKSFSYSI
jgi:hypothetical protein